MYFWKYILAKKAGLSQKKCNMALYGLPVLPIAEAFEKTVTGNPISVSDALAQDALSLQVAFEPTQDGTPWIDSEPTTEPYLAKTIPRGNKEYYSVVGASVAWNQIVQTTDFVSVTYGGISGTNNGDGTYTVNGRARDLFDVYRNYEIIANHVYFVMGCPSGGSPYTYRLALASENDEGSGLIYKSEYGGNTTLAIRISNGTEVDNLVFRPQLFDLTLMFGSTIADYIYSLEQAETGSGVQWLKEHGFLTKDYYPYNSGELISVKTSGHKVGSTTYPFSDTELRGLFKLDVNNKLYAEGDLYHPSGTATRNYEYRAYQSGDESLADAITDGTHTVVKLTTPTTESLTPYTSPIVVEQGGTEEFIDDRTVPVPVGNETYYAAEYAVEGKTGVTVNHSATSTDIPTEYEVQFTSQGTVYGGTVDIVSGVLTVPNKHFTFNSLIYYGTYGSDNAPLYYCDIPNYATEPVKRHPSVLSEGLLLSNIFAPISTEYLVQMKNYEIRISDAALPSRFYMRVDGQNPVSTSNPLEIVAELQTPQTYNLTPEQVTMLLGNNYLVTEDGTITITYMAGK